MDNANEGHSGNGPRIPEQPSNGSGKGLPPYEFYQESINEAGRGWITAILAFMKDRAGGEVVAVVAILALWRIATELIRQKSGLDTMTLAGCLAVATLIFVIGLLAMLRVTKAKHAKDTQENESEKAQPRVGNERTNENGTTARRDRRTQPDGSN